MSMPCFCYRYFNNLSNLMTQKFQKCLSLHLPHPVPHFPLLFLPLPLPLPPLLDAVFSLHSSATSFSFTSFPSLPAGFRPTWSHLLRYMLQVLTSCASHISLAPGEKTQKEGGHEAQMVEEVNVCSAERVAKLRQELIAASVSI